jgi:hypothetical protein
LSLIFDLASNRFVFVDDDIDKTFGILPAKERDFELAKT